MSLIDYKSLLAKLMATENLTVEQRKVPTASFDVRNRILTVPVLDNDISPQLYDLFMGHEVGHALYTPFEGMSKAIELKKNMSVLNVVEDSRIERKIKYKYPGLRNSFIKAYQELLDKDFFGVIDKDVNELNFIDRLNLYCKGGVTLGIQFTDFERDLLNDVETTETYDDVIEVADRIVEYMKMKNEEIKENKLKFEGFEEGDEQGTGEYEEVDIETGSVESNSDDEKEEKTRLTGKAEEEEIRSFTDDAYRENESRLFDTGKTEYNYVNIPKVDVSQVIFEYKDVWKRYVEEEHTVNRKEFNKFRQESNKVVSYLVKEFEMRKNADQMKRSSTAKTGDLDMNKIFSYQFNEDIFKKTMVVPGGKSHGLVLFLDWSGSMSSHIGNTVKQLFNLVMFCKKVNIPFEVYAFVEETEPEKMYNSAVSGVKNGDIVLHSFGLVNLLSSKMSASEMLTAGGALFHMAGLGTSRNYQAGPWWLRMTGTPLNEAIICAMEIVPAFQKKNKLQIVNTVFLTDGEGRQLSMIRDDNDSRGYSAINTNSSSRRVSHVVMRDPKTKNQEKYETTYGGRFDQTNGLIRLLRKRTNSHVVGFYVATTKDLTSALNVICPETSMTWRENFKESFKKNKFGVIDTTGFDEYYMLRSNGMDTEDTNEMDVNENSTTRKLVSEFSKYTNSRVNNRVILNRFIKLIA